MRIQCLDSICSLQFKVYVFHLLLFPQIDNPVKVFIQLQRPSDQMKSEPRRFDYLPLDSGRPFLSFKRLKQTYGPFTRILGLESPSDGIAGQSLEIEGEELKRKLPVVRQNLSPPGLKGTSGGRIVATLPASSGAPDDVKLKVSAALKKRNPGIVASSVSPTAGKLSPLWSDTSCYSDAEVIDDFFSDSSINDILSGVGGETGAVYQDLEGSATATNTGLNMAINNTLNLLSSPSQLDSLLSGGAATSHMLPGNNSIGTSSTEVEMLDSSVPGSANPDALYGDASYASCYSNLQFVMNRAKNSSSSVQDAVNSCDSLIRGSMFPGVPSKSLPTVQTEDIGIYEVPSNKPVHATKQALLLNRGFVSPNVITEVDLEPEGGDMLPKTVLDLFVW